MGGVELCGWRCESGVGGLKMGVWVVCVAVCERV